MSCNRAGDVTLPYDDRDITSGLLAVAGKAHPAGRFLYKK
jgi:hypothetical protein